MQDAIMDFEAINAHVEEHYASVSENAKSFTAQNASAKLCGIYKVVRPILVAVSKLIFIPKKWKAAITSLIAVLDVLCP